MRDAWLMAIIGGAVIGIVAALPLVVIQMIEASNR